MPSIVIALVANSRRQREIAELNDKVIQLSWQLEGLKQRSVAESPHVSPATVAPAAVTPTAVKISAEEARASQATIAPSIPAREPVERTPERTSERTPEPQLEPQIVLPAPPPPPIVAPPAETPIAESKSPDVAKTPVHPEPFVPDRIVVPPPPPVTQLPDRIAAMLSSEAASGEAPVSSANVRSTTGTAGFRAPDQASVSPKKSVSLEEMLGTNWLPKLGIAIVVIGVGFLIGTKWGSFSPWLRVAMLYLVAGATLAGGIFTERKERYQTLGRSLIGGGWAVIAAVTYALRHVPSMAILPSDALDLILLVTVIGVMVWHTLKYDSQLITGASFLLGFAAIALNPDPPYNLLAGALLVAGMTVIVLRRKWFELEVFCILASYLNHLYWLYNIFDRQADRRLFADHNVSMLLVIAYWAVFRASYLIRKVENQEQESVSTIAALLNPLLLLAVVKYQSFHPEWAFPALLIFGAVEFVLGQLPVSRRRKAPFHVLSSLGAAMMVAAVPFRYSGDSLETLWLIGAEAFLLAGIFTRERLFRGFGLIVSALVVLYALPMRVLPLMEELVNGQAHYHAQLGIGLAVIAAVLYANAHVIRGHWPALFQYEWESHALRVLSFAASVFAVGAAYALVSNNAIPIVLALLVAVLSFLGQQFGIEELVYQAHWIAAVTALQTFITGQDLAIAWHGLPGRVLLFMPVAALLYLSARHVRLSETDLKTVFAGGYTWAASTLLALLVWYQAPRLWIAPAWVGLAFLLAVAARYWKDRILLWQTHVLSFLAVCWTLYTGFAEEYRGSSAQLFSVVLTAALLYALNWIASEKEIIADERFVQAYSWAASLLLSWLAWYQLPAIDVSLMWGVFGLALFLIGDWKSWSFLRAQGYVALICSFAHIFYANFNVLSAPGAARPEVVTVVPLVAIYFFVYWQLHGRKAAGDIETKTRVEFLLACLGTATLAALARFELPLETVAVGYAAIVVGTLLVAWFTRLQVFLFQALVMLGFTAFRVSMHNFYLLHESYSSGLSSSIIAIALLAAGVPICLNIRRNANLTFSGPPWLALLAQRAEQLMFFVPFTLLAVLLALKVNAGMITLAWGAQAVLVFVLALWAKERSFRFAGLGLLLLCVAKIVFWDVWRMDDPTSRYLTLIGVGVLVLVVSYLISRNREALREYL
ncbi:MAG TPA: DUF2339 domain-containing protein [Candidatus Angelobacter sp.]|nr:DUF2339 domain-containing protein [Candidatus Angelobacter sp.]